MIPRFPEAQGPFICEDMPESAEDHRDGTADEATALMLRARDGDSLAFARLYERYLPLVTAHVVTSCGPGGLADDIAQEVFMRLWARRREYRGQARFITYLFAYVHNVCLEARRLCARQEALPQFLRERCSNGAMTSDGPEMTVSRMEVRELVEFALRQLPDSQRQALRLYYTEGLSLCEAAKSARCTQKSFESRLSRGRARLRCLLYVLNGVP